MVVVINNKGLIVQDFELNYKSTANILNKDLIYPIS